MQSRYSLIVMLQNIQDMHDNKVQYLSLSSYEQLDLELYVKKIKQISIYRMTTLKQDNLLEQYTHKLQDENKAKTQQIRVLRQQLSRASTTSARIITSSSSTTTNVANCTSCKGKDQEIANLGKTVKEIQTRYDGEIKKLSAIKTAESKVVYREVESKTQQAEYEKLKRLYDELKAKYEEGQKVEWQSLRVDGSESINRNQVQSLRNENGVLVGKVDFLEKRLIAVQEANRVLRQQLIANMGVKNNQPASPVVYSQQIQQEQPIKTTIIYNNPVPTQIPISAPLFRVLPAQKTVSFQLPTPAPETYSYITRDQEHSYNCGCTHLSPLAVLNHNHNHQSHHQNHNHFQPHHHYHHHHSHSQDHSFSLDSSYYKDIVEERWRSLQHKIKLLEQENGKLRTEVTLPKLYS